MTKDFGNETFGELKEAEGKSRCPLELHSCPLGMKELDLVTGNLLI